jgi:hypothetical protein
MKLNLLTFVLTTLFISTYSHAQEKIKIHIGIAHPLMWHKKNELQTIGSNYSLIMPFGILYPISKKVSFDMEFLAITNGKTTTTFVAQPGLLFNLNRGFFAETKPVFELTGRQAFGFNLSAMKLFFIPLNKEKTKNIFIAFVGVLPFRFGSAIDNGFSVSPTFVNQVGISF